MRGKGDKMMIMKGEGNETKERTKIKQGDEGKRRRGKGNKEEKGVRGKEEEE